MRLWRTSVMWLWRTTVMWWMVKRMAKGVRCNTGRYAELTWKEVEELEERKLSNL